MSSTHFIICFLGLTGISNSLSLASLTGAYPARLEDVFEFCELICKLAGTEPNLLEELLSGPISLYDLLFYRDV